ncbi:MAG: S-layer homology domain-containing protein [Clostridia bacterium]|nr:S-layer homology domain-containing protein [Clostridia bacterium]
MKRILSLIFVLLMTASCATVIFASKTGFSDVEDTRWSASSIAYAVAKGYMNGVGDGKFDPTGSLTRGMVATVLWRREGSPAPTAPSGFVDVPAGAWYADAVAWAKETGVVNGMTETTFAPNGFITREQLATMLFRFSSSAPVSVPERADLTPFADDEKTSGWARESLEWAVEAGLINGTDGNRLAPGGNATREQFAAIIERYDNTFWLQYNTPILTSRHTVRDYPLVTDADFYVATDGDDGNDGSFSRPFKTWDRAIKAVRGIPKTAEEGGITVAFMAGEYDAPHVTMTAEDSGAPECPVTYCKYGDGDVTFNGGIDLYPEDFTELDESEKALFNEKYTDNIKKYDISSVLDSGLDKDSVVIFSEDWLCTPARYPNRFPDGSDSLLYGASSHTRTAMKIIHPILAKRIASYSPEAVEDMEIYGYIIWGFKKSIFGCASYDAETSVLETDYDTLNLDWWNGSAGLGIEVAVLDIACELDCDGEYWIDAATKTLYVYSPNGVYHIPVEGTMISMDGTNDITFRGLGFQNTTGAFIEGELCHGVTIDRCTFSGVSSTAGVSFRDCSTERALDLAVTDCEFSCAYGQSLYVNGGCSGAVRYSKNASVLFDNNLVSSSNLVFDDQNAVDLVSCSDLRITHNRIEHTSRGSISFSMSYNVLIEYNDFDSAMINSQDGGILYSAGNVDGRNVTVRHNFFNYMEVRGIGAFGYYVDDNEAGVEIYANLFYDELFPVVIHKGRDNFVHDNVFIRESTAVSLSIGQMHAVEEYGTDAPAKSYDVRQTTRSYQAVFDNMAAYPEYLAGIEKWCPELLNYHLDYSRTDDPNFVMSPVNTIKNNVHINSKASFTEQPTADKYLNKYTVVEGNRGFTTDENPFFVNPTVGDYRLKDGAGIMDIEIENIGRY